jgi:hypothetical protein
MGRKLSIPVVDVVVVVAADNIGVVPQGNS